MIAMLTNINFYYPSHNYPFEATNFSTKAWDQQLDLEFLIHMCTTICLARDVQRMCYWEGVQARILTQKLELFSKFKRTATRTHCEIWIIRPQLIKILHIFFIIIIMHYHIHERNRKFSKPQNHFVGLLEPWEFRSILSWITYNEKFIPKSHTNSNLQIWYKLLHDY
jgi:hypothetical protein